MNYEEKKETVASLANLLRETTQKKMVTKPWEPDFSVPFHERSTEDLLRSSMAQSMAEPVTEVEYYNVLFSPDEVATIKRKFLQLVSEL